MKIALVIEQLDTARGGREVSTAQIASGLARRGHEVTVLCQQAHWQCEGVRVQKLGTRGLLRTQRLRNFAASSTLGISLPVWRDALARMLEADPVVK